MNAVDGIMEELNTNNFDYIEKEMALVQETYKKILDFCATISDGVKIYQETGVSPVINIDIFNTSETDREKNEGKENVQPSTSQEANVPITRASRLRGAKVQNGYEQTSFMEKAQFKHPSEIKTEVSELMVKLEINEMAPPTHPAPRKTKRTKAQKKIKQEKESLSRESDVLIQEQHTSVICIDSDDEQSNETSSTVATGTSGKRARSKSSNEDTQITVKKRSTAEGKKLNHHKKDADDVSCTDSSNINATFIATKPLLNATVVVENPKVVRGRNVEDLMTDDESEEDLVSSAPITKTITKAAKQVFSPFEQSPVKRKVQAFEKLAEANAAKTTIRNQSARKGVGKKEQSKLCTPTTSRFIPAANSTSTKTNKVLGGSDSSLVAKTGSALKASQEGYRRRREKEEEALKKREAQLQAQVEDKKRKREEKQLKAQQQREVLEKEKLKAVEAQRVKDERHQQLLAEQEDRKQKLKEEADKKRMLAKTRKLEEQKKAQTHSEEKVQKEKQQLQVALYMRTKAPLLPTEDCYDSDDERYAAGSEPAWSNLNSILLKMINIGEMPKNSFFCRQAQTPDLRDIFEVIDPKKLKRTSSAHWRRPPRFTMMPLEEMRNKN